MYRIRDDHQDNEDVFRLNNSATSRTHHFKFEHSGMLVYDSKACLICGQHTESGVKSTPDIPRTISAQVKKDLETADEMEAFHYKNMREYTPMPTFAYDYLLEIPNDEVTLKFNSKFESGNLYKAIKLSDYEYTLFIHNDIGTYNQNHWYYFSAINPRKTSITFKIANMRKKDFHYINGMQPAVYSKKTFRETGIKWHRDGYGIMYTENTHMMANNFVGRQKYYTLSFTYTFKYEHDEVFFAYSVPYTYADLSIYLENIQRTHSTIAEVTPLCKTIAGNTCYKLLITENIQFYNQSEKKIKKKKDMKVKKGIVLMARTHSGETVSSYMMKGAIDFLLSTAAKTLRKNYVFSIVPMLNPDGVRYGSYRASLLGVDLNRRWQYPNKILHPTVYYTKKMIEELKNRHEVMLVCDMHGHTKKKNVFMYGCSLQSPETVDKQKNLLARVIPYQMYRKSPLFSFTDSHFRIEKSKESTARIVLFQELDIVHSYTMEASFFGPDLESLPDRSDPHFSLEDLENLGRVLCQCCYSFSSQKLYVRKVRQTNTYLKKEALEAELKADELTESVLDDDEVGMILKEKVCEDLDVVDVGVDPESSGSDSDPSDTEESARHIRKKKSVQIKPVPVVLKTEPAVRTPITSVKPAAKKPQVFEVDWNPRKTNRSPVMTAMKPQETLAPQSFHFPLQSRFNPFAIEVKLRSEVPELDQQKKIPKISRAQQKHSQFIGNKSKTSDLYLPALLNVSLPDIQSSIKKSPGKHRKELSEIDAQRQMIYFGSTGLNE